MLLTLLQIIERSLKLYIFPSKIQFFSNFFCQIGLNWKIVDEPETEKTLI